MFDKLKVLDSCSVTVARGGSMNENIHAHGEFNVTCYGPSESDRSSFLDFLTTADLYEKRGQLQQALTYRKKAEDLAYVKWESCIANTVTTAGKNAALDIYLEGAAYTVIGPYMGLISGASFSTIAAADTMSSHSGWYECGTINLPTYTAPRKTCAWSAAGSGSKALSSALSFSMTDTGTVLGCFLVFYTGATSTVDSTTGTLYSAGGFTGGSKSVGNGDTLSISYTAGL